MLGVSGECGERQAVLNYGNSAAKSCGLGTTLFAELAAGAGVRAYGVPSHAGGLRTNIGESRGGEKWTNAGICGHCGVG